MHDKRPAGSIVLLRDVTELRLRERELVSKEATIREIHHRVKNNLQTVAALLRLQGRRMDVPEAREALDEAVRRVGSIALVHETLSQSFDENVKFDDIADRLLRTVLDVTGEGVRGERIGTFGSIPGVIATPLAMVLTELIQNAAQHAFGDGGGHLTIAVNRIRDRLRLRDQRRRSRDAGRTSTSDQSLGLSIVTHARGVRARRIADVRAATARRHDGRDHPDRVRRRIRRADAGAGVAALERTALVLAHAAPDTVVLPGFQRPLQALLTDVAPTAHDLGLLDLEDGRAGIADREEELWVFVEARAAMAPVHDEYSFPVGDGVSVLVGRNQALRRTSSSWFQLFPG